jgi:Mn2+/Fe2+ NRAMP family transporter
VIAISIFIYKEAGKMMDTFTKLLGFGMILLTCYVAYSSHPPMVKALAGFVAPQKISLTAIITIVGGTVGGYITFAGAHRLLDAGITGKERLREVTRSAASAIGIASLMRILLFLGALGVVYAGFSLDPANPPASVFKQASGQFGYKVFGIVIWAAAITSVVGSAYTSVSFIKSFHPILLKRQREIIIAFILVATVLFLTIGQPVKTLIVVGALNGLILPVSLGIMLYAAYRVRIVKDYKHPLWLTVAGGIVVALMTWMGYEVISSLFGSPN